MRRHPWGGGFVPTIISAWAGSGLDAWAGAAAITAALCLVNIVVVLTGRETYRVPTPELGKPARDQALTRDAGLATARGGTPPPDTA